MKYVKNTLYDSELKETYTSYTTHATTTHTTYTTSLTYSIYRNHRLVFSTLQSALLKVPAYKKPANFKIGPNMLVGELVYSEKCNVSLAILLLDMV